MSYRDVNIALLCCNSTVDVEFRHDEAPGLPPGHYRKNVICPNCESLLILSLTEEGGRRVIEQELIDI